MLNKTVLVRLNNDILCEDNFVNYININKMVANIVQQFFFKLLIYKLNIIDDNVNNICIMSKIAQKL